MILKRNVITAILLPLIFFVCLFLSFNAFADRLLQDKAQHNSNLWERVRSGFALTLPPDNKAIRKIAASYIHNPHTFNRIVSNSERYLFYIIEEVERRGMPMEIALLPIIESAYDPLIKSDSRTAGLWQFIPETGRIMGLEQNVWHDDRRDIVASTQAALDYLQYLYQRFDNWKLAIAAYNLGEGAISKILAKHKHKGRSIYDLNLPVEVKHYVYKLLAIKDIIANAKKYGIQLRSVPNRPYFDTVKIHEHIDIPLVARLANISEAEFTALNPAYNRYVIKVLDEPRTLLIPKEKKELFVRNLETYQDPRISWQFYRVKKGEKINDIAVRHETSVKQLQTINGIARNKNLTLGQKILVPEIVAMSQSRINSSSWKKQLKSDQSVYVVKKGDTLYEIARRYRTTVDQIKRWNNSDERLSIGQKLVMLRS
ncbi:LysM peptidoglycan-binding domain-containing protein [Nitrosomonas supralitoralis]|uniref:Lytic transglycosylase n=1 Tax=Nitrosomonas supralitoralis TaxID=2116706 RepID=A0A2P7NZG8_9PROT|nr:LysM peptidoglycan-binding domain-containing protein [Nitrosomonas supralitoralis]PSJ18846.1 lytic transglycosylase [Nitrosomonas supralitoralis]